MRIEKASGKAIKYACMKFHYAKAVPQIRLGYSVFNDANEWCGVVLFSNGANRYIASEFGYVQGQVVELVRVALNGKQNATSQVLAATLRQIKKDAPAVKLIVSYADRNQNHIGIIYQATNWLYLGEYANERGIMLNGKLIHRRSINSKYGTSTLSWLKENVDPKAEVIKGKTKIKYVFPLNKWTKKELSKRAKPYPKKEMEKVA
ncbi:MAG: protein Mom [Polaribacter sp.]|uniref:Mom family adenine methylcarbamoylation protein n=1 Tax=Polaribacter sp. TaxID=1920175 RepID=UPI002F354822